MAKKGMKRYGDWHSLKERQQAAVPEIQGKAKHGNKEANPIIAGTHAPSLMVYHSTPHQEDKKERPISSVYSTIDTDLARDNLENDMSKADMQDLF